MSAVAAGRTALLAALVLALSAFLLLAAAHPPVAGLYSGGLQVAGHHSGGVVHEGGPAG